VPLAEHDNAFLTMLYNSVVSIHVPLAEHDLKLTLAALNLKVSIHVPLAEHDKINLPSTAVV